MQNRDSEAIKLDELIRAVRGARNELLDLEQLDEAALDTLREHVPAVVDAARRRGHRPARHRASPHDRT